MRNLWVITLAGLFAISIVGPTSAGLLDNTPKVHAGIKGGVNVANVSVDSADFEAKDSLQGFTIGAWWGIPVGRVLTIQPEALYSRKGDSESDGDITSSTQLGYIDVPVLAKVGFLHGAPAQPSLFVGPLVGFNLSATSKLESNGETIDADVQDQIRPFEVGLVFGGGLDFQVGTNTVGVDVRYTKGLSDIAEEGADTKAHNDVFAVMGSIAFQ